MRRFFAVLVTILLMVASVSPMLAQDATPTGLGEATIGQPVTVYGPDGAEAAQITVTEVIDPFEDWSQYLAPQVGERYVAVTLQITNTGQRPFEFAPTDFMLLDAKGSLYYGGMPFRSEIAVAAVPDLEGASMLPGETVVGALNYVILADAVPVQVVYTAFRQGESLYSNQILYLLADLTR